MKKRKGRKLYCNYQLEEEYFEKFVGQEVDVLIEVCEDGKSFGHTSNYLPVKIEKEIPHNIFYKAEITGISYPYCIGK